ncbi:hypothetical protein ACLOJK_037685 [Asimina triloba]
MPTTSRVQIRQAPQMRRRDLASSLHQQRSTASRPPRRQPFHPLQVVHGSHDRKLEPISSLIDETHPIQARRQLPNPEPIFSHHLIFPSAPMAIDDAPRQIDSSIMKSIPVTHAWPMTTPPLLMGFSFQIRLRNPMIGSRNSDRQQWPSSSQNSGGDWFELPIMASMADLKRMEGLPAGVSEERMLNLVIAFGVPAGSGLGTSSVFFWSAQIYQSIIAGRWVHKQPWPAIKCS